uniref:Uncharacterized protein n=1 Tax=Rhizophora mucronata TaxID=61149 RepID=A0A2P2LF08_RHIMU
MSIRHLEVGTRTVLSFLQCMRWCHPTCFQYEMMRLNSMAKPQHPHLDQSQSVFLQRERNFHHMVNLHLHHPQLYSQLPQHPCCPNHHFQECLKIFLHCFLNL